MTHVLRHNNKEKWKIYNRYCIWSVARKIRKYKNLIVNKTLYLHVCIHITDPLPTKSFTIKNKRSKMKRETKVGHLFMNAASIIALENYKRERIEGVTMTWLWNRTTELVNWKTGWSPSIWKVNDRKNEGWKSHSRRSEGFLGYPQRSTDRSVWESSAKSSSILLEWNHIVLARKK